MKFLFHSTVFILSNFNIKQTVTKQPSRIQSLCVWWVEAGKMSNTVQQRNLQGEGVEVWVSW